MKNVFKYLLLLFCLMFIGKQLIAQNNKIKWYSFEEAVKLNAEKPKKVFMDIYTEWCGWCKVLDKTTFTDTTIIRLMNENFYAVKFDAERKDTIVFHGYTFVNPNPKGYRSTHQLASSILQGKLGYPSMVFMNDSMQILTTVQSYLKPPELEPILAYFGHDKYLKMSFDTFKLTYKIISTNTTSDQNTKPFVLNKVVFDAGKSEVSASAFTQLDSMAIALKGNTKMKIEINGYTDNTGNAAMNKTLSEKRAKAVYDYFVSKGVENTRMSYAGYGSLNPIAETSTAAGQKLNRRIEIKIISK